MSAADCGFTGRPLDGRPRPHVPEGNPPPKFSIAFVIGFLKGKSAVLIHRRLLGHRRVTGMHFWARGNCVSTVGLDEATIRRYIREQEVLESNQMGLDLK